MVLLIDAGIDFTIVDTCLRRQQIERELILLFTSANLLDLAAVHHGLAQLVESGLADHFAQLFRLRDEFAVEYGRHLRLRLGYYLPVAPLLLL